MTATKKKTPSFLSKPVLSSWWIGAFLALDYAVDTVGNQYSFDLGVLTITFVVLVNLAEQNYQKYNNPR